MEVNIKVRASIEVDNDVMRCKQYGVMGNTGNEMLEFWNHGVGNDGKMENVIQVWNSGAME